MPTIAFTSQLRRFVPAPTVAVDATTLRQGLQQVFSSHPRLAGYVLDDQGGLRPNVVVFIDGRRCTDRVRLDDALLPHSQVHVMQALSGG